MVFTFPDLDTLQLALTSGAVPSAVALASVVASFEDDGRIRVTPSAAVPRAAQTELRRLGVQVGKALDAGLTVELSSWLQLLPLTRLAEPVAPSPGLWPRIQASLNFAGQSLQRGWSWWTSLGLWRSLTAGGFATAAVLAFVLLTQQPAETRFVVVLAAPQDKSAGWVIQASSNKQL